MSEHAVLLVNLGSPRSCSVADVRRYLAEFLGDERVLDLPKVLRQLLLRCIILPLRAPKSAAAYATIWQPEGSPLITISQRLQTQLQARTEVPVELAMRYGEPAILPALERLIRGGLKRLLLIPLYPHYAMSSYETVVVRVRELLAALDPKLRVDALPPFYDHPEYIEALYQSARQELDSGYDHLLFSYHGLPIRHLKKADSSRAHCLAIQDCCAIQGPAHATCYRAQTIQTSLRFVQRASVAHDRWSLSYQSRLAGEEWQKPYTERELARLGEAGVGRLLVLTPAFVADCLETLEEISIRGRRVFLESGGGSFQHIQCLNDHPSWVDFLERRLREWMDSGARAGVPVAAH